MPLHKITPRVWLFKLAILAAANPLSAQHLQIDLFQLSQTGGLVVQNRQCAPLQEANQKGIRVSEQGDDGVVWINGIDFANGIVELDIRGKDVLQQSFVGVALHGLSRDSLEVVYLRPFNFRSTDSTRRKHAVQYACHPNYPWDKLRQQFPGKYESQVDPPPDPNQWFHVKILLQHPHVTVYVNHSETPCLVVNELPWTTHGKIGLWVGNNSGGDFANLSITSQ